MYNVSEEQSKRHFYMLNMDTHGKTHMHTHIHTNRGPWKDAHKLSATSFKRGTLRPKEKPPHTLRLNSRLRDKTVS